MKWLQKQHEYNVSVIRYELSFQEVLTDFRLSQAFVFIYFFLLQHQCDQENTLTVSRFLGNIKDGNISKLNLSYSLLPFCHVLNYSTQLTDIYTVTARTIPAT
jgi:hypothetical protein